MWSIGEYLNKKEGFNGIISSYLSNDELNSFKNWADNAKNDHERFVCVFSSSLIEKCLKLLDNLNQKGLIVNNRLVFVSIEDYIKENHFDIDTLLDNVEKEVKKLSQIYIDDRIGVYVSLGYYFNLAELNEIKSVYSKVKELNNPKRVSIFIKYVIEDIDYRKFIQILDYHDYIFVDGINNLCIYKPEEFISRALDSVSKNPDIQFKYNETVVKSEYLENLRQIVGGVIHDVNNLLVSILGYAQYSLQINDMEEIKKSIEIITRLALDGSSITKRVKENFNTSFEGTKSLYRFDNIIQNCIDMIKHKFKFLSINRDKKLELSVSLNSKRYIYANEYEIRHSIINIIQNGIDAIEDTGIVTVVTYDEGENVVLEISDTGSGIEEDMIEKIFMPFFTTKGSKGTGLGLSIAKKIFEKHGGRISVESQVGEGTKFTISFPSVEYNEKVAEETKEDYNIIREAK